MAELTRLVTGHTHQIRLHFAYMGCNFFGDYKYKPIEGQVAGYVGGVLGEDATEIGLHALRITGTYEGQDIARKDPFIAGSQSTSGSY